MTSIVLLQVLFRYVLNAPLFWTEESARYIMIWIVYLGASVGLRRGSHVGFTYFLMKAPGKLARWFFMISHLGILVFCINITYFGTIISLQNIDQASGALEIPIALVYLSLPVAGVLCMIQIIPIITRIVKLNKDNILQQSLGQEGNN